MEKKILIITGDGGEGYETWYAIHRFREADFTPVIAAPTKKRLHLVMHDFEPGWDTYIERPGYQAEADISFEQVVVEEYVAVLLIGGRSPEYLRNNKLVLDIVRSFDSQKKWILSICHGIQIAAAAGLVKNRKVCCYEHVRFEVESIGGSWLADNVACDGNLISAPTWQAHPEFYREIFKCI